VEVLERPLTKPEMRVAATPGTTMAEQLEGTTRGMDVNFSPPLFPSCCRRYVLSLLHLLISLYYPFYPRPARQKEKNLKASLDGLMKSLNTSEAERKKMTVTKVGGPNTLGSQVLQSWKGRVHMSHMVVVSMLRCCAEVSGYQRRFRSLPVIGAARR